MLRLLPPAQKRPPLRLRWAILCGVAILTLIPRLALAAESALVLQLKWYHQFQFAGYYAAEAKGYYKEAGLNVVLQEGSPTRPPLEMVLSGKADFGVSDDDVLLARLRGKPTVVCAAIFQHSPYIIMARADRDIHKPSDLVGKRVMVARDQGGTQLKAMLIREGIATSRVEMVPHTWNLTDLIEGRVDAVSAYRTVEPTQLRQAGVEPAIIRVNDYGVDFYGDTLFTREAVVKRNPEQAAAFVRASLRGWEYAMAHPSEMIDLILKMPGVKERGLKRENLEIEATEMRRLILPDVVEIGHMNPGRWERMQQIFVETGLAAGTINPTDFIFSPDGPPIDRRHFWILAQVLAAALIIGGIVLLWTLQLRRKVETVTREVSQSGANLTALIENTTAAIWSVDRDLRYITFNSHFRRIVGENLGSKLAVGMSIGDVQPPERAGLRRKLYERALNGEHFITETELPSPKGPRIYEQSFSPIISGEEVTGVTVFSFDITEQRKLEEQLRQSQKMDAIGQLAGGVAHDFNNLLMVIQGNASLALMSEMSPEEARPVFQDILAATERAAALTGQLLAFSRRQPMQPRELNANTVVFEVARMLERLIGEHIALETKLTPEPTPIHADTAMIEQVLLNLAVNARDAMPQGGRLTITTSLAQGRERSGELPLNDEMFIRIDVTDTGVGIAPEHLPHIFEPFFTTKEVGKGTGLGLATAFGIAQQHGGWLAVTSTPGQGSTFSLFLPRHEPAPPAPAAVESPQTKASRGSETILVVEDETTVRTVVVHALKKNGYRIFEAASGHAALELWDTCSSEVDLLLTDMVMPGGVSGHELAQQLLAKKPTLKVIYTSGYSADVFRGDSVLPEHVAFLRKPYRAEELLATVRQTFDNGHGA